jgi:hypothetical protein
VPTPKSSSSANFVKTEADVLAFDAPPRRTLKSLVSQLRRKRGIHVNPWSYFPRVITSIDFLKRERPFRTFRETLPAGDQPTYPRAYDPLIVDEAHNVAPSGRGKYATDSMRTEAIRALTPHFEHILFLSATPHNGYRESFASLLELLDSQRFSRIAPDRTQLEAVLVRRMKSGLKLRWDGSLRFSERIVKHLEVPYTDEERLASRNLRQYSELRLKNALSEGERIAAEFVLKLLKNRLFSSPATFGITLEKHMNTIGGSKSTVNLHLKGIISVPHEDLLEEFVGEWEGIEVRRQGDEDNENAKDAIENSLAQYIESMLPHIKDAIENIEAARASIIVRNGDPEAILAQTANMDKIIDCARKFRVMVLAYEASPEISEYSVWFVFKSAQQKKQFLGAIKAKGLEFDASMHGTHEVAEDINTHRDEGFLCHDGLGKALLRR